MATSEEEKRKEIARRYREKNRDRIRQKERERYHSNLEESTKKAKSRNLT